MLIFFQGCTLYNVCYLTLDEASKAETKVKVETKSGEKFKFKRIGIENGEYYGVKKVKGDFVKVPLNKEIHNEVLVKDSTISTIFSGIIGGIVFFGILVLAAFGFA